MASATVTGTVSRINQNGIGFGVKETWPSREGREATRYWSVWMPEDQPVTVAVGDRVKITGLLGTKVSTRDNRYVDHTVNRATVEVTAEATPHTWGSTDSPVPQETEHTEDPGEPSWVTASIPEDKPF